MRKVLNTASLLFVGLLLPTLVIGAPEKIDIFGTFVSRSNNSATISWNTSPHTKGYVSYAGPDGIWKDTPWSKAYLAKHEITILQLKNDTTYLYRIHSENEEGLYNTYSGTFSTLAPLEKEDASQSNTVVGSFQALLSPTPIPTAPQFQTTQPYGQNVQFVPYVVPLQIAISQAPVATTAPDPVLGVMDSNPTTTTQGTFSSSTETTLVFILGLIVGVILITLATHTLPKRKQTIKDGEKQKPEKQKEYNFTLKQ